MDPTHIHGRSGDVTTDIPDAPKETVNHPPHYKSHPSGVECIQITRHMNFNLGNAVKYIWRCDTKKDAIEDLKKAMWYIQDEITKREISSQEKRPEIFMHYEGKHMCDPNMSKLITPPEIT